MCCSLEREEKHSDARAMHADLELGLQLWRERCAALQETASLRAQERAQEHREDVRAKLRRSNQRRRRQHRATHARSEQQGQDMQTAISRTARTGRVCFSRGE